MPRRLGWTPLWGDFTKRKDLNVAQRVLAAPLRLWEIALYDSRPNTLDSKIREEQWDQIRGEQRYWHSLVCYLGPPGHIIWNVKWPLLGVMMVAVLVVLWEQLRISVAPSLPTLDPNDTSYWGFRLSAFAMSLILSMRLGRAYDRWWQARQGIGNCFSAMTRAAIQAQVYFQDEWLVNEFVRWTLLYIWSIYGLCIDDKQLPPAARALLDDTELHLYEATNKARALVFQKLQQITVAARLTGDQAQMMDSNLSFALMQAGLCSRIRFNCLPYNLTLLCTGFIQIWLCVLPFGMFKDAYWFGLLPFFFMALLLLGADEVASQLEEPFTFMPCQDILRVALRDIRGSLKTGARLRDLARRPRKEVGHVSLDAQDKGGDVENGILKLE